MFDKYYDLTKPEELAEFYDDCTNAIMECPQARTGIPCFEDFKGFHDVFKYLFRNEVLWRSGYNVCLTFKASQTFKKYAMSVDGDIYYIGDKARILDYRFERKYHKR